MTREAHPTAAAFVKILLALPDPEAQRQYLALHVDQLDNAVNAVAEALKAEADRLREEDVQQSLVIVDLLQFMATLTGLPHHRALGLLAEANVRTIAENNHKDGLALYTEAINSYQAADAPLDAAKATRGMVWALACAGCSDEALATGVAAAEVLEAHGAWADLAQLLSNLGAIHGRRGEDTPALACFDRAMEIHHRLGTQDGPWASLAQLNRGVVLRNLGQFDASIAASRSAIVGLEASQRPMEAARARQNLAETYLMLGHTNAPLAVLDDVREEFLRDGRSADVMWVDLVVMHYLLQLRRFQAVLEIGSRVRATFADLDLRIELGQAILNEAVAHAGLADPAAALAAIDEARRLFDREGNAAWVAASEMERAGVLFHQADYAKCLAVASDSAGYFRAQRWAIREGQALLLVARAAARLGLLDQADEALHAALAIAEPDDLPSLLYGCYSLQGELVLAQGDLADALAACDRAIAQVERLQHQLMIEYRAEFLEDKGQVYAHAVDLCLRQERPELALAYAERAKSRTLVDLVAGRVDLAMRPRAEADRALVEELAGLQAERNNLYREWPVARAEDTTANGKPSDAEQAGRQPIDVLEKRITALWHRLLIRNADYASDAALWQAAPEPVQTYLAADTMLIEYFILPAQLVVFLVTSDAIRIRTVAWNEDEVRGHLGRLAVNFDTLRMNGLALAQPLLSNARGLLTRLYDLLIGWLADDMTGFRRLVIVPHGVLHYVPFHALCDGRSYLIERHAVSYLPASGLLGYCQTTQSTTAGAAVFGYSSNGALPSAPAEAEAVAKIWDARAWIEEEATLERVRVAAADCRLLHLATHGDFRNDNPLFSGLSLADGSLTTLDIFQLRTNASLVTLSACQTGRHRLGGGDELLGLMRAFLYAGTPSLVLSLWATEDQSTAALMDVFYRGLWDGGSKADSLRQAQLALIDPDGRDGTSTAHLEAWQHPFFWAPFVLVGHSGPL